MDADEEGKLEEIVSSIVPSERRVWIHHDIPCPFLSVFICVRLWF